MLDLTRYVGRWYELGRYPNWFETGDSAQADYALRPDGLVSVVNTSVDFLGRAIGTIAGVAARTGPTTLEVCFPATRTCGEYRVEFVDPSYQYAIVGNSGKTNLWLLSRAPVVSKTRLSDLLGWVSRLGYDPTRVHVSVRRLLASSL